MANEHLIPADELCAYYNVELSFINALHEYGLIQMTTIRENYFIDADQLQKLEQYTRLHYDLDINVEGIEAIDHLLERLKSLQDEMIMLKNRLRIYEER